MYLLVNHTLLDLDEITHEDFDPQSTARALSRLNRFCGNFNSISVAQHAVVVSELVAAMGGSYRQQLAGLHHDDCEAICADVPSPLKRACRDHKKLEDALNMLVELRYDIDLSDELVAKADFVMGMKELIHNANEFNLGSEVDFLHLESFPKIVVPVNKLVPWPEGKAYATYLDHHRKLTRMIAEEEADAEEEARKDMGLS